MASGMYTHTHTRMHTLANKSDYKKPGMPGLKMWLILCTGIVYFYSPGHLCTDIVH